MKYLAIDIETGALPEEKLTSIMPDFKPRKGTKDPDKIEAQIQEKKDAFMSDAALSPVSGQVLAFGYQESGSEDVTIAMQSERWDESRLIVEFWNVYNRYHQSHKFVGSNLKCFDIFFVVNRTRFLGLSQYLPIQLRQVGGDIYTFERSFIDIQDIFKVFKYNRSTLANIGLDMYAKAFGFEGKNGDGAMFQHLFQAGKLDECTEYLENDIRQTMHVAHSIFGDSMETPLNTNRE